MCIRIFLPADPEHLVEAQWALIDTLARIANADVGAAPITTLIQQARDQAASPHQWAAAFVHYLSQAWPPSRRPWSPLIPMSGCRS